MTSSATLHTTRRTTRRGFTLIEVLAATALFIVLGTMLFQMVQGAMDLFGRGQQVRDAEEKAGAVLDLLAEDLHHLWTGIPGASEQDGRLLCGYRVVRRGEDGSRDQLATVLRFTRLLHEERSLPWLRRAGERPAAERSATLTGVEDPATLLPTSGLAETLYTTATLPGETLPSLVRRVLTPIGGADSLLAPELPEREDRLLVDAVRLADRVLHFEVRFWAPDTGSWDGAPGTGEPARVVWDSTRSLLDPADEAFPYGHGPDSLLAGYDDMFPRLLSVRVVLDVHEGERVGAGRLASDVSAEATIVSLALRLSGVAARAEWLWIDGEWMAIESIKGRQITVQRGVRGTLANAHDAGAILRVGRSYQRIVAVPTARVRVDP